MGRKKKSHTAPIKPAEARAGTLFNAMKACNICGAYIRAAQGALCESCAAFIEGKQEEERKAEAVSHIEALTRGNGHRKSRKRHTGQKLRA